MDDASQVNLLRSKIEGHGLAVISVDEKKSYDAQKAASSVGIVKRVIAYVDRMTPEQQMEVFNHVAELVGENDQD